MVKVRPYVVAVNHVSGCTVKRSRKCHPECERIVNGWEVDILTRLASGETVRERVRSPVSGKTASLRWGRAREAAILAQGGTTAETRDTTTLTVGAYLEQWLAEREARGVASIRDDKARLRAHVTPALGKLRLAEVRPHHIRDFLRDLRSKPSPRGGVLAPRSIRHIYFTLRQACHEAVVDELIIANPVQIKRSDLPGKEDKDGKWRAMADFTREEVELLISDDRVPEDRRVAYAMEFLTGMRTGEVSARRWRDYDASIRPLGLIVAATAYNSRTRVEKKTKTGVTHWIPVHSTLAKVLARWKLSGFEHTYGRKPGPDELIVPGAEGGCRNVGWALKCFHEDLRVLGLRHRRHYDTRATFLSLASADGAREDMLRWITHPSPRDAMDGYKRLSLLWPGLCQAMMCLKVELREGRVINLPSADRGDVMETGSEQSRKTKNDT